METPQPISHVKIVRSDSRKREIRFIATSDEVAEQAAGLYGSLNKDGRRAIDLTYTLRVSRLYKYGDVWRYLRDWGSA